MKIKKIKDKIWTELISLETKELLSSYCELLSVSEQGLTVLVKKQFFNISENDWPHFLNNPVELFLSQYEIPFYGIIKKIKRKKKDSFEIKINFMETTPVYYRECLIDLFNYPIPA